MFLFGVVGWLMRRFDFPAAPLVLGLILGRMVEENLRRALILSGGQVAFLLTRPIALVLLAGTVVSVVWALGQRRKVVHGPQGDIPLQGGKP